MAKQARWSPQNRGRTELRAYRDHASEERYQHLEYGFNSRMDEIQAAILSSSSAISPNGTPFVLSTPATYDRLLADTDVRPPQTATDRTHAWYV